MQVPGGGASRLGGIYQLSEGSERVVTDLLAFVGLFGV